MWWHTRRNQVLSFWQNGWVHLNRQGCHFSRLLAAEVCASVVVMLDTWCSKVVWRVLAAHSTFQFPLHFPSCASPCAVTFQLESNKLMANTFMWLELLSLRLFFLSWETMWSQERFLIYVSFSDAKLNKKPVLHQWLSGIIKRLISSY